MRVRHIALSLVGQILDRCYTLSSRGLFAECGPKSRIGRCSKFVSPHLIQVGSGVILGEHTWLNAKDDRGDGALTLRIGDGTYIGRFAQINAWRSVTIGNNVLIADRVYISDAEHKYGAADLPIKLQGDAFSGAVNLQDGCWIGIGAVILPGVTVGRNAVVAANSVVTKSVPDRSVAGGNPAQIIKQMT